MISNVDMIERMYKITLYNISTKFYRVRYDFFFVVADV